MALFDWKCEMMFFFFKLEIRKILDNPLLYQNNPLTTFKIQTFVN